MKRILLCLILAATALILEAGLPEGIQIYRYPADQIKSPAVVIGTTSWVPIVQNALAAVQWTVTLRLLTNRSMPVYGQVGLETWSVKVGQLLSRGGYMVEGFESDGTESIGGIDYLAGTLTFQYRSKEN